MLTFDAGCSALLLITMRDIVMIDTTDALNQPVEPFLSRGTLGSILRRSARRFGLNH